jgi:acetyl-CoA carboxylase biotin carboxyl carrier protein
MPEPAPPDRTPAQRVADHASLARLSETLVPALVSKLASSGLGELEVREGDWRIRLRRPASHAPVASGRRGDRPRMGGHPERDARPRDARPRDARVPAPAAERGQPATTDDADVAPERVREVATSPAVGVFRPGISAGSHVRAGDRIGIVDLLGIPQDVVAPLDGTLVEVFPQAGDPVEYGEEIAVVEQVEASSPGAADAAPAEVDAGAAEGQVSGDAEGRP